MRFTCDVMLGKLAKYLRALGFDTVYLSSPGAAGTLAEEHPPRILLTRRRGAAAYPHTVVLHSERVRDQLRELQGLIRPHLDPSRALSRCLECNRELVDADRSDVEHLVPEFVYHHYARFMRCPSCGKVYWPGSHAAHMGEIIEEVLGWKDSPSAA